MFQYKETPNNIFKYVVLAVGLAVILGILWFIIGFSAALDISGGGGDHYYLKGSTVSPDNNYLATSYVMMGGGAAGWCYKLVKIRKLNETSATEEDVFKAKCSSEVEVNWINGTELNIAYSEQPPIDSKANWNDVRISHSLIQTYK